LNGPSAQVCRDAVRIEEFNEVIFERGTGVAPAALKLADNYAMGAVFHRGRRRKQDRAKKQEKAQRQAKRERFDIHRLEKYPRHRSRAQTKFLLKTDFSVDIAIFPFWN